MANRLNRANRRKAQPRPDLTDTITGHRGGSWTFLTIPPGGSGDYNKNPTMEKGR